MAHADAVKAARARRGRRRRRRARLVPVEAYTPHRKYTDCATKPFFSRYHPRRARYSWGNSWIDDLDETGEF